jgi:WD40 repeat protein
LSGGHTAALQWASFDPTGQHVVTASADTTIVVWDTSPPKERAALHWHGDEVNQVEFSPDGKWILSASDDGTVKVGQCEVCSLGVQELRRRVEKLAYLPEDEQRQLERQIDRQSSFLTLQAFWSKR